MVLGEHDGRTVAGQTRETFGTRLRRLREERGHSIVDTAIGVSASEGAIRQLETGNVKSPSYILGIRLARYLNVDPFYLAIGEGASLTEHLDLLDRRVDRLEKLEARVAALEQRLGRRR
jgi:transcriptional regulator with XRE-family HTH domain